MCLKGQFFVRDTVHCLAEAGRPSPRVLQRSTTVASKDPSAIVWHRWSGLVGTVVQRLHLGHALHIRLAMQLWCRAFCHSSGDSRLGQGGSPALLLRIVRSALPVTLVAGNITLVVLLELRNLQVLQRMQKPRTLRRALVTNPVLRLPRRSPVHGACVRAIVPDLRQSVLLR